MIFFPKNYVIERTGQGDWIDGEWIEAPASSINIIANAQPVTGLELDSLDRGRQNLGKIKIYTNENLIVSEEGTKQNGDIFIFDDGNRYEIIQEMIYNSDLINHNKYLAELRK